MIHDKEYFYKYVTVETALKILQNRTLKYSSPVTFNDPFDSQTRMDFDFEMSEFYDLLTNELYRLISDEREPVGDDSNMVFKDIKTAWHTVKMSSFKMPKNIYKQQIKPVFEDATKLTEQYIEDVNSWWMQLSKASKVFCLSENYDNLLMWAHYSKDHTGAVIKFKCLQEIDSQLCAARKVNYSGKPPVIAKLDEYIRYTTGQIPHKVTNDLLFYDLFLTKSKHWKYEQEWRVFIPPFNMASSSIRKDENGKETLFDFIPFSPQEIHSIYFGCRMENNDIQKVKDCLVGDFEHVKKYNCMRSKKEYKLEFEAV